MQNPLFEFEKKTREERHPPLNLTLNLTKYKHEHK